METRAWQKSCLAKTRCMKPLELTGMKFGRLLVIESVNKGRGLVWRCLCDCGTYTIKRGADLNRGQVKSCGCLNSESSSKRSFKHGLANTRFHNIWIAMRQRCNNPNASRYRLYGERGITVCERWEDFGNFKDDMYESYLLHVKEFGEKDTSIERENNFLGYSPENCRWATQKEQVNNRRKKVLRTKVMQEVR